ncbi:MAG: GHMP kinase [Pirellulales bacterium]|nr:GHMP kinase [Pirellulales bacterium]
MNFPTYWQTPADAAQFGESIRSWSEDPAGELWGFFAPGRPISAARAPGRLDVMGGIADYSGSLVLQMPTREATLAAIQRSDDARIRIVSFSAESAGPMRTVEMPVSWIAAFQDDYASAREWFEQRPQDSWAAYIAGVFLVMAKELGIVWQSGLRVLVESSVPEGKGVSSSAALEVAVMQAAVDLLDRPLDAEELARLCQVVENRVVGAPCGIMDQMTAALGRPGELLALLCQPATVQGFLPIPPGIHFWGIDSGIRHAVSGCDYTSVRIGAFMGYRILAELAGLASLGPGNAGVLQFADPQWNGYLAKLSVERFEREFAARMPLEIRGEDFIRRYGGLTDPVTRIDPQQVYAVRRPTAHPICEHARVRRFAELLPRAPEESAVHEMGQLMYGSHESYSACGLGSAGTDLLVEMVREAGPAAGLYGAKITGGGSGGTVAILGRSAGRAVATIAEAYRRQTGQGGYVFSGSSPGASLLGGIRV